MAKITYRLDGNELELQNGPVQLTATLNGAPIDADDAARLAAEWRREISERAGRSEPDGP
jgi:hypothetical protein